jgi:hypothetical protein
VILSWKFIRTKMATPFRRGDHLAMSPGDVGRDDRRQLVYTRPLQIGDPRERLRFSRSLGHHAVD